MADQPSRVIVADRQMSDAEALMWRVEKDPFLASTFGAVTILDRPPDFDRLRARMESAVHAVARLGWRVQPNPTGLGTPIWADDPDFDIDLHVRRVALPAPGTLRQLLDLATVFVLDPLDRTRPLWQFLVVEGLANGKAALITKMHHTITDGVNGIRMSMQYFDLSRNATEPAGGTVSAQQAAPLPPPTPVDSALSYVHATFRLPISIARQVGELLADPTAIPAAGSAAVDGIRGALTQLSDSDAARSPLWTNRSMRRRLELARAPFGFDQGGGQAPRGFDQRRLSHRRRRGRSPLSRRSRAARSTNCAPRWRSARAPRTPEPTPSGSSSFSYRPAR